MAPVVAAAAGYEGLRRFTRQPQFPGQQPVRQTEVGLTEPLDEAARRTKRRKASVLTQDWGEPTLSKPGLLGLT